MNLSGLPVDPDPLERAKVADHLMWSARYGGGEYARARDAAVREAVGGGIPVQRVAEVLRVRVADVERMVASASERARPATVLDLRRRDHEPAAPPGRSDR